MSFATREAKEILFLQKLGGYDRETRCHMFLYIKGLKGKRRRENKTRKILKLPFQTYIEKIKLAHPLFGASSLVLIQFSLHLIFKTPRALKIAFLRNLTMEV